MGFSKRRAFTIVELIIVIAAVAILTSVLIPVFGNIIANAKRSSAMQTAKNTLEEYNTKYITETKGTPLPEGMVFESGGYWFVFIDGRLYEITADGDYSFGDFTASCWVSSPSSGGTDIKAECDSAIDAQPCVTIDGDNYNCTDVGYLKTEDSECIFAFYTGIALSAAYTGSADGCDVYAGRVIKSLERSGGSDVSENANESGTDPSPSYTEAESHAFTTAVTGCTANTASGTAQYGSDLTLIFTSNSGYTLTDSTLTVKIGDNVCTVGTEYSWNSGNGNLTINGNCITGDIDVSLTAVSTRVELIWNIESGLGIIQDANGLEIIKSDAGNYIDYNKDFNFRIVMNGGNTVSTIKVTRKNGFTWESIPYGYNETNGCYFILGGYITNSIEIDVYTS